MLAKIEERASLAREIGLWWPEVALAFAQISEDLQRSARAIAAEPEQTETQEADQDAGN